MVKDTQRRILLNRRFASVAGDMEALLFYRLKNEWEERKEYSSLLEQMQLATTLGKFSTRSSRVADDVLVRCIPFLILTFSLLARCQQALFPSSVLHDSIGTSRPYNLGTFKRHTQAGERRCESRCLHPCKSERPLQEPKQKLIIVSSSRTLTNSEYGSTSWRLRHSDPSTRSRRYSNTSQLTS